VSFISIVNDGADVLSTNYWDSDLARAGKLFCSVNGGAIRVLLPRGLDSFIYDLVVARECVVSRGPWPEQDCADAVEIMWDDGSERSFAVQLTPASFDALPGEPPPGREWRISVWVCSGGAPLRFDESACRWRRVERIPCLLPWAGGG
jgi:hypothetical protein